jgi:D-glycero-alpha-D-manno-heptose-7-phosphate kinase
MIISRTPFRISFFGGGTDYPAWYREQGGAVLSTTFNKYCHVSCRYLPPFFDYKYLIRYRVREETRTIAEINHPSVRECLTFMGIDRGVEIIYTGDVPGQSGIGSSSAFTVGLLNALSALKGQIITKRKLARDAIHVEQEMIKENVGAQDQVATSFGGFNRIDFGGSSEFYVTPLTVDKGRLELLQSHLMLFFTGFSRTASNIAAEQIKQTPNRKPELTRMKEMVDEAVAILGLRENDITDFGKLMHEAWKIKKCLSALVTTPEIEHIYETARSEGAIGGKLLGAGGGGFMLLFVRPDDQARMRERLGSCLHVPFAFEELGSQLVLYSTQNIY